MKKFALLSALMMIGAAPAFAAEHAMTADEAKSFLVGATVEGMQDGLDWKQSFRADGGTTYTTASGPTEGKWEMRGDKFCSNWPPADSWACYTLMNDGENVSFNPDGGATPWPAKRTMH